MVLKKQALKATIWEFFGKISGNIISFVFSIFLARLLNPDDFGTIAIISGIINISSSFWDAGLGSALIQRKEVDSAHYSSVQFFNVFIGLILFMLFYFLAPYIAEFYDKTNLTTLFRVMSCLFFINSFGQVYRAKLRRNLDFSTITKTTLFGVIVGGAISVLMAYNGYGIWSLVTQFICSATVSNCYLFFLMKEEKFSFVFSKQKLIELWDYGFKMFVTNIIEIIMSNLDSLAIGKLFSSSVLGMYYRAKSLNSFAIEYSAGSVMNVYFRIASHYQNQLDNLYLIYKKISSILLYFTCFVVGLLFVFSKDIILIVFGEKWLGAHYYFSFILISSITTPLSYLALNTLSGAGKSRLMLKLKIITKSILLVNLLFAFSFGIKGFMLGLIFATTINYFIESFALSYVISFNYLNSIFILFKQVLLSGAIVFITYFIYQYLMFLLPILRLSIGVFAYSLFFLFITFLFKIDGLTLIVEEIKKIRNKQ